MVNESHVTMNENHNVLDFFEIFGSIVTL